eukprot:Hpha_TRINITY_DN22369_c0_g1::TRINITY_DN22369_c0_g1_i1::g.177843::m.177843
MDDLLDELNFDDLGEPGGDVDEKGFGDVRQAVAAMQRQEEQEQHLKYERKMRNLVLQEEGDEWYTIKKSCRATTVMLKSHAKAELEFLAEEEETRATVVDLEARSIKKFVHLPDRLLLTAINRQERQPILDETFTAFGELLNAAITERAGVYALEETAGRAGVIEEEDPNHTVLELISKRLLLETEVEWLHSKEAVDLCKQLQNLVVVYLDTASAIHLEAEEAARTWVERKWSRLLPRRRAQTLHLNAWEEVTRSKLESGEERGWQELVEEVFPRLYRSIMRFEAGKRVKLFQRWEGDHFRLCAGNATLRLSVPELIARNGVVTAWRVSWRSRVRARWEALRRSCVKDTETLADHHRCVVENVSARARWTIMLGAIEEREGLIRRGFIAQWREGWKEGLFSKSAGVHIERLKQIARVVRPPNTLPFPAGHPREVLKSRLRPRSAARFSPALSPYHHPQVCANQHPNHSRHKRAANSLHPELTSSLTLSMSSTF